MGLPHIGYIHYTQAIEIVNNVDPGLFVLRRVVMIPRAIEFVSNPEKHRPLPGLDPPTKLVKLCVGLSLDNTAQLIHQV